MGVRRAIFATILGILTYRLWEHHYEYFLTVVIGFLVGSFLLNVLGVRK